MIEPTIKRVLVAPLNYSHKQNGQLHAFREVFGRLGAEVREFDFMALDRCGVAAGEALLTEAKDFQPDWIWLQVQGSGVISGTTVERIRAALPRCFISHWMGDCRLEVPEDLAALCRATHATLISSVGQIPLYQKTGAARVHYVQIGLDWVEDVLGEPDWTPPFRVPDIVFCGGHYDHVDAFKTGTSERIAAVRCLLKQGFDVGVVGRGWPNDIRVAGECHVKQQHHIYKRAKIALSISHFNDIERYYSDRLLIAMASGTAVVAKWFPGIDKEFALWGQATVGPVGCYAWADHAELVSVVRYLLSDEVARKAVGDRGRQRAVAEHTWTARIADLLPKIEAWRKEDCL